ncbi:MAG: hypothetical protein HOO06_12190 [Bdellovibrionaceae bacterium]|nr:hypothetical protein [Pseudobdellovibrionaceae bacterium]
MKKYLLILLLLSLNLSCRFDDDGIKGVVEESVLPSDVTYSVNIDQSNLITIVFSSPIYNSTQENLTLTDFTLSIIGGVSTLGSNLSLSMATATSYTLDLDLQSVPNGQEVLTVSVVDDAVTDLDGQIVSVSEKTVNLKVKSLRLVAPVSTNVNSQKTLSAVGGAEAGYVYSLVSGEGTVGSDSGVFFSGNNVGTTVINVQDSYGNSENVAIHVGGTGIYAVGGYDGSTLDSVEVSFNGIDWTLYDAVLPSSHGEAAMKVYKDKLWFVGGYPNSSNVFESSDGTTWINRTGVLPSGIDWGNTAVFNENLYYVGGNTGLVYSSSDPANSWSNIGGLNGGSTAGELFTYHGKMWYADGGAVEWTDDAVTWTSGLTLPASRSFHAGTVFDDKMWLVGGSGSSTNVWWSIDGDNWNETDNFVIPSSREDGEMVTFNGRMWYVAGSSSGSYTQTNLSSEDGDTWETHTGVMNTNRDRFAMEVFTDKTKVPDLGTLAFDNHTFATNDFRDLAYKESNTTLFAASYGAGLQISANNGATWANINTGDGLPSNNITSVFVDRQDDLWVGSSDSGVGTSNDNGTSWTNYSTTEGLVSNNVSDIFVDRSGTIYVATDIGLSISANSGATWASYDSTNGIATNAINDIYVDFNFKIYVATNLGLSVSSDGGTTWTTFTDAHGLGSSIVNEVTLSPNGLIYLATPGGLSISVDGGTSWRNINTDLGLATNDIKGISIDNYGVIYASTALSGLMISVDESVSWTSFSTTNGLGANSPQRVTVSDAGKSFITTSGGISISQ